jgi:homoserine/homoserine lactone efflux protein
MDLALAISFWSTNFILSITPGPAVVNVMDAALRSGLRPAQASIGGILLGNVIYIALALLGLGAVFTAVPGSMAVLRWLGAAYIGWLGIDALRSWRHARREPAPCQRPTGTGKRLFADALALQLANPKSVLFFGAMLPQFVLRGGWPPVVQMALLGAVAVLLEYPVLCAYAWLARRNLGSGGGATLQLAAACLLLLCALRMLLA